MLLFIDRGLGGAGASASTCLLSPSGTPWHSPGPPRPPTHTCWARFPGLPRAGFRGRHPHAGPSAPVMDREAPHRLQGKGLQRSPSAGSQWASWRLQPPHSETKRRPPPPSCPAHPSVPPTTVPQQGHGPPPTPSLTPETLRPRPRPRPHPAARPPSASAALHPARLQLLQRISERLRGLRG